MLLIRVTMPFCVIVKSDPALESFKIVSDSSGGVVLTAVFTSTVGINFVTVSGDNPIQFALFDETGNQKLDSNYVCEKSSTKTRVTCIRGIDYDYFSSTGSFGKFTVSLIAKNANGATGTWDAKSLQDLGFSYTFTVNAKNPGE